MYYAYLHDTTPVFTGSYEVTGMYNYPISCSSVKIAIFPLPGARLTGRPHGPSISLAAIFDFFLNFFPSSILHRSVSITWYVLFEESFLFSLNFVNNTISESLTMKSFSSSKVYFSKKCLAPTHLNCIPWTGSSSFFVDPSPSKPTPSHYETAIP